MSELDAAVQLVKVEIDSMQYVFRIVGTSGLALAKSFAKLIKFLGKEGVQAYRTHKIKNIDNLCGEVCLADFKEKYRGDNIEIFALHDYDADTFIDMCKSQGVAVVKLPDMNVNDGMSHFMIAGSTSQLIKYNIERLSDWHIKNKYNDKYMKGEVPDFAFVKYAEKKGDNDIIPVKVRDEYSSPEFLQACKDNNIPVMRKEGADKEFFVSKSDFDKEVFQEVCSKYMQVTEDKVLRTVELSELKSATSEENYVSGKEIDAIDYVMSAPGDTAEEKQANFIKQTEKLIPRETLASVNFSDKDQVYNLLTNASNDERMMLCESNDYESFPVYENMIVGEDDKILSVALNGNQYDIDKSLVVSKDGYTRAYVPRNSEDAVLGNVTCGGRKIDAKTLNKAVREKRNINVTDAVKDINVLKSGRSK